MSTTPTLSVYKDEVIAGDISGLMGNITEAQFVSLLNQAIINKHEELVRDCPLEYDKDATLTFASDSYSIDLPSDASLEITETILLFVDESRSDQSILPPSDNWRLNGGQIRFEGQQKSGKVYYIEYTKEPNEYDLPAVTELSLQTFAEGRSRRAKKYLAYEIRKLFYDGLRNNEPSAAGNKLRIDSNDIS